MTPRAVLAVCVDCCQIVCWYLYAASLRDSLEIGAKLTATRETEYDRNGYHTLELFYRRTSHGTDALLIVMTFAKKKKKSMTRSFSVRELLLTTVLQDSYGTSVAYFVCCIIKACIIESPITTHSFLVILYMLR